MPLHGESRDAVSSRIRPVTELASLDPPPDLITSTTRVEDAAMRHPRVGTPEHTRSNTARSSTRAEMHGTARQHGNVNAITA